MAHIEDLFDNYFNCSICLDVLKDPVTIPCGHFYCRDCINGQWNQEHHAGIYRCPQCRRSFIPRPVVEISTVLAEVVQKLKKTGLLNPSPGHCYAGPSDVVCNVCIKRRCKAVKSCLVCLASYCETHLKVHNDLNPGNTHKLTDATEQLQDKICSHHHKLLEVYCYTDQQCICLLCVMDKHRGHDAVPVAEGRTEKQKQLRATLRKSQQRLQQREKEVQELREAMDSLTPSAQAAVDHIDHIFTEMICSIKKMCSEMKEVVRAEEKAAVSQTQGLLDNLEQEIDELRKQNTKMVQLSHIEDHIHFLRSLQPLCVSPGPLDPHSITVTPPHGAFEDVKKAVSDLKIQLEETCKEAFTGIHQMAKNVLQTPEPRIREEFLQSACQLTLDPNTVNKHLCLSKRNTVVTSEEDPQPHPDHPERFDSWKQVLCREALTGPCYWEVQWKGQGVCIALAYKGVSRKGRSFDSSFGYNSKSWSLFCSPSSYYFWHHKVKTLVSAPSSSTIGVHLDHREGTLSFYSVSDTMNLLHRVQTTFTEPLYPGFEVCFGSEVKLLFLR